MKKGNIKQIIITVIAVTIGSVFGKIGVEYFFNKNNTFDKQMMCMFNLLAKHFSNNH